MNANVPEYAVELRRLVMDWSPRLDKLDDAVVARRPSPGKWSVAEIIGHLVDSASNNHQRFVRAGSQEDLIFLGYEQDAWVRAQAYQTADWANLVALWRSYNLHLAAVMAATPVQVRTKQTDRHNFDQIGFRVIQPGAQASLDWFMADYVEHLKHHLRQVSGLLAPPA
jgi:hypothetical protein